MGQILAVVTINKKSGLPADAVQNSFAFTTASVPPSGAEMDQISTMLGNFYSANGSLGSPVANWFPDCVDGGANKSLIEFYDITGHLDGSPHGSPIRVDHWTLAGVSANGSLPDEVAVCLSYHGDFTGRAEELGITRPKARRRGRLYIGPLGTNAINYDGTTKEAFVTPNLRTTLLDAALALNGGLTLATWRQWSRKDAQLNAMANFSVDNAFDIQRRRGNKATVRQSV